MTGPIVLTSHDPMFADYAGQEHHRWADACGDSLVGWHHIGSTAVPGLIAKPVLGLMPVFTDLTALDALAENIQALGYDWRGEYGISGRRYCWRNVGGQVTHAHCYAAGHPAIARHIRFRDYLRANPDQAAAYGAVKKHCAALHTNDRAAYVECKTDWIVAANARA